MAYLDMWAVGTQPQWWTAALYQRNAQGSFVFKGYLPSRRMTWAAFHVYQMDTYSVTRGWRVYPFYWDTLAGVWMRQEGQPALAGDAPKFDASAGTQKPAPDHNAAAPFGETSLSVTGKLVVGALAGGAAWYLYNYGWPGAKPRTNNGRKVR